MFTLPGRWSGGGRPDACGGREQILYVNWAKRSVEFPGLLGARLRARSGRSSPYRGVGDCVYIDLAKMFFAVADSPERNTRASYNFVMRFAEFMEEVDSISAGNIYSERDINLIKDELERSSAKILESVPFRENSTFTGLCVFKSEKGPMGILFHSGDSFLLECDLETKHVRCCTRSNFLMIGRTRSFPQLEVVNMAESKRYLLGTDGFSCLELPGQRDDFLMGLFETQGVEMIADFLVDNFAGSNAGDDIALLSLDPAKLLLYSGGRTRLVMGGTSSREEEKIQLPYLSGDYSDWYEPYGSFSLQSSERLR